MHLATARAILATPRAQGAHDAIPGDAGLIWAEHGDEVDQWNAVAATQGWGRITVRSEDGPGEDESFFYTFKGEERRCPFEGDRDDNLRSVLFIAELVRADADLYACNDHAGNSEQAFLALSPQQWRSLASEFGADAMAFHFTRAAGSYDEFCDVYFRDENVSPDGQPEPDPADIALTELMDRLRELGAATGHSLAADYTLVMGSHLNILIASETRQASKSLFEDGSFGARVTDICKQQCQRDNYQLECIAFLSQEEMDADHDGTWTFGWMVAGACAQLRFDVTPYAFAGSGGEQDSGVAETATWQERAKGFSRKHWLTISFFSFMLALLIYGKISNPSGG
jgi:hypothetical protein